VIASQSDGQLLLSLHVENMLRCVYLSVLLMLYQTHRLLLLCATTTSLPGTHCTYWQKLSRLLRCWVAKLNRCSW
jgi:hypothetical protein